MAKTKPIDKVTTTLLDAALRSCGIQINICLLDKIIDVVELLEDKGDKTTLLDLAKLELDWEKNNIH